MKKILSPIVFVMAVCLLSLAACKSKVDTSPKAMIVGKWQVTKIAYDDNNNNTIDAGEIQEMSSDSLSLKMSFDGGGSGELEISFLGLFNQKENFTWSMVNNNTGVSITGSGTLGSSGVGTGTFNIATLTMTDAVFYGDDTTGGTTTKSWMFMKRI